MNIYDIIIKFIYKKHKNVWQFDRKAVLLLPVNVETDVMSNNIAK